MSTEKDEESKKELDEFEQSVTKLRDSFIMLTNEEIVNALIKKQGNYLQAHRYLFKYQESQLNDLPFKDEDDEEVDENVRLNDQILEVFQNVLYSSEKVLSISKVLEEIKTNCPDLLDKKRRNYAAEDKLIADLIEIKREFENCSES